ncbi:MAG: hypothetical protein COU09_01485 [Candidatus Harrisonbacteria bacterium CG10_big_fil_rev_8_21_14_0_10_44_23]|uniref:Bifunctional glucose-6-phosphate/mannose-6-phosphate isomerase C-terminal domain-containing protein n=1 Tax=Candidatus Harrisonbacteria bacterium CG10_big_fil_rev_8_21_14_0_10_44_23 TaxID=1974585 RepID=A0A2H0USJ9_9BACT|nr:MAG: hypothetical protein COU09_01485 [Candidatus Harrisonbacteria bacterium CG10_big_fil_rev_8_21_14_0_10_44_23]
MDDVWDLKNQLSFTPAIENREKLKKFLKVVVGGMGGSRLAADLLPLLGADAEIVLHNDYDLPHLNDEEAKQTFFVASSFSGNTKETLSFAREAIRRGLSWAVISSGGELLELAELERVPFVRLPEPNLPPRDAMGYSIVALAAMLQDQHLLTLLNRHADVVDVEALEDQGRNLARALHSRMAIIYASKRNKSIAYNWKIRLNESAKIAAFSNIFPEVNHNEVVGFLDNPDNGGLLSNCYFIFLYDEEDDKRLYKQMQVTQRFYEEAGYSLSVINLTGKDKLKKIFNALILADECAKSLAKLRNLSPNSTPSIENLKRSED